MTEQVKLSERKAAAWAGEFEEWTRLRMPPAELLTLASESEELSVILERTPASEDTASDNDCISEYYAALDQIAVAVAQHLLGREWPKQPGLPRVLYTGNAHRSFYSDLEEAAEARGWGVTNSGEDDYDSGSFSENGYSMVEE